MNNIRKYSKCYHLGSLWKNWLHECLRILPS